jgi:hypothetical protein
LKDRFKVSVEPLQPIILSNRSVRSRPPKKKRNFGPALWKLGLCGALCFLVVGVYQFTLSPYVMLAKQRNETARLDESLSQAQKTRSDLKWQIHRLQTGDELKVQARKNGYLEPGEELLRLTPPDKNP